MSAKGVVAVVAVVDPRLVTARPLRRLPVRLTPPVLDDLRPPRMVRAALKRLDAAAAP